jgi:biotin operon repressor
VTVLCSRKKSSCRSTWPDGRVFWRHSLSSASTQNPALCKRKSQLLRLPCKEREENAKRRRIDLLRLLSEEHVSQVEAGERLGVGESLVRHDLKLLEERGYVFREKNDDHTPGQRAKASRNPFGKGRPAARWRVTDAGLEYARPAWYVTRLQMGGRVP